MKPVLRTYRNVFLALLIALSPALGPTSANASLGYHSLISKGASASCSATGGTVYTFGSRKIHRFTTSDNLVIPAGCNLTIDFLIVGAGGGGGNNVGGGGEGGCSVTGTVSKGPGSYPFVIGAGGVGSTAGSDSTFDGNTADGGNEGLDNADASGGGTGGCGGDGGKGEVPVNSGTQTVGVNGTSNSISGTAFLYGPGGGGGAWNVGVSVGALGGSTGGGKGGDAVPTANKATNGTANTGAGGGGDGNDVDVLGGTGGDGIGYASYPI